MFSIIIPIYNSESTLDRCLQSIQKQTDTDFEVILIDDGSTDRSSEICRSYLSDQRFHLITQENSGPSAARNAGLDVAVGEYIAFVDSDDYVALIYLEEIRRCFQEQDADAVFVGFGRVDGNGDITSEQEPSIKRNDYYEKLCELSEQDHFGYTWCKALRRKIVGEVRFDETLDLFEDEVFTCAVLREPLEIKCIRETLYYYVRSDTTLATRTHQDYPRMCDAAYRAWKELLPKSMKPEILHRKSEHFRNNCYYYLMERDVRMVPFCEALAEAAFVNDYGCDDLFLNTIKKKKWCQARWMTMRYRLKNKVAAYMRRRSNRV